MSGRDDAEGILVDQMRNLVGTLRLFHGRPAWRTARDLENTVEDLQRAIEALRAEPDGQRPGANGVSNGR